MFFNTSCNRTSRSPYFLPTNLTTVIAHTNKPAAYHVNSSITSDQTHKSPSFACNFASKNRLMSSRDSSDTLSPVSRASVELIAFKYSSISASGRLVTTSLHARGNSLLHSTIVSKNSRTSSLWLSSHSSRASMMITIFRDAVALEKCFLRGS